MCVGTSLESLMRGVKRKGSKQACGRVRRCRQESQGLSIEILVAESSVAFSVLERTPR
jgi:hypothetical protein